MKFKILTLLVLFVSCSTTKELKSAQTCKVWEDQAIGPFDVDVAHHSSRWEGRCKLLGLFWCSWVRADFESGTNDIYIEGNGIFNSRKKIASLKNDQVIYEKTFLDSFAKSGPIKIDTKNNITSRTVTSDLLGASSHEQNLHFNNQCTTEQVALGVVALYVAKNK